MAAARDLSATNQPARVQLTDEQKADLEELLLRYTPASQDFDLRHRWAHNLTVEIAATLAQGLAELTVTERRILKVGEFAPDQG